MVSQQRSQLSLRVSACATAFFNRIFTIVADNVCVTTSFEQGPRIVGARYLDMKDIATTKELFPELNPKGLPTMLPTKVDIPNSPSTLAFP